MLQRRNHVTDLFFIVHAMAPIPMLARWRHHLRLRAYLGQHTQPMTGAMGRRGHSA